MERHNVWKIISQLCPVILSDFSILHVVFQIVRINNNTTYQNIDKST